MIVFPNDANRELGFTLHHFHASLELIWCKFWWQNTLMNTHIITIVQLLDRISKILHYGARCKGTFLYSQNLGCRGRIRNSRLPLQCKTSWFVGNCIENVKTKQKHICKTTKLLCIVAIYHKTKSLQYIFRIFENFLEY